MNDIVPVCRWLFQEAGGSPRISEGKYQYALQEMNGPINRVQDGIIAPYSAEILQGQWFNLSRSLCPALNFHGKSVQYSIMSWIKRKQKSFNECETISGLWNESLNHRQYCLFLNLGIWNSSQQVCGHVSSTGGPSPGYQYCMEASIGNTAVSLNEWHQIGVTFDGNWVKGYLDGKLDYRPGLSPYFWPCEMNNPGDSGADFTVGAVNRSGVMGNFYVGLMGGLSIYDQVLTEQQIQYLFNTRQT